MSRRLPYDTIATEANRLFDRILSAKTIEEMKGRHDEYAAYLEAVGWTDQEFDMMMLERINKDWEAPKSKPVEKPKPKHILN